MSIISIKKRGIILIKAFQDILHKRLTNQFTAVHDRIFFAIPIQCPHLTIVEHNTHPMSARLLFTMYHFTFHFYFSIYRLRRLSSN